MAVKPLAAHGWMFYDLGSEDLYEIEIVATSPDGYERRSWHTVTIRPT